MGKLLVEISERTYEALIGMKEEVTVVAEMSGLDSAKLKAIYAKLGEQRKITGNLYKELDKIYKERNEDET